MNIQWKTMIALVFAAISAAAAAADIWYEDNNLGRADGMPPDFVSKFSQPELFSQASSYLRVYMVRSNVLTAMSDGFLADSFRPYLTRNNIKLAVDAVGATWMQASGRKTIASREIRLLERLKRLGIQVDYVSLQSVLSKPLVIDGVTVDYPMSKRIKDAVTHAKSVRKIYPQAQIGIIDAIPSHVEDYRQPYLLLKNALARERIALSYIHLDMPFDIPREQLLGITWPQARAVESYVEDVLGIRFGFMTTSAKGGRVSSREFHERVLAAQECYLGAGGTPTDFIIASWFPFPQTTIPETATGDDYPAMRTVLEYGRQLDRIGRTGGVTIDRPGWVPKCSTR